MSRGLDGVTFKKYNAEWRNAERFYLPQLAFAFNPWHGLFKKIPRVPGYRGCDNNILGLANFEARNPDDA